VSEAPNSVQQVHAFRLSSRRSAAWTPGRAGRRLPTRRSQSRRSPAGRWHMLGDQVGRAGGVVGLHPGAIRSEVGSGPPSASHQRPGRVLGQAQIEGRSRHRRVPPCPRPRVEYPVLAGGLNVGVVATDPPCSPSVVATARPWWRRPRRSRVSGSARVGRVGRTCRHRYGLCAWLHHSARCAWADGGGEPGEGAAGVVGVNRRAALSAEHRSSSTGRGSWPGSTQRNVTVAGCPAARRRRACWRRWGRSAATANRRRVRIALLAADFTGPTASSLRRPSEFSWPSRTVVSTTVSSHRTGRCRRRGRGQAIPGRTARRCGRRSPRRATV
jgi:hypothetical protein